MNVRDLIARSSAPPFVNPPLKFMWLEITNRCNERCSHCYNDSGPHRKHDSTLSFAEWLEVLSAGARLGCRGVQFIGGEPTLVPELPELIGHARRLGFELIEVFTNGTAVTDRLLDCFVENQVQVAVSLYGTSPQAHDRITILPGSFLKTVDALRRMHAANVPLRVGVIAIDQQEGEVQRTMEFVRSLGIASVGTDHARAIGRAEALTGRKTELSELCGQCWQGNVCVLPNGRVSPCIMSRDWAVGSVRERTLEEIIASDEFIALRKRIYEEVWVPRFAKDCTMCSDGPESAAGVVANDGAASDNSELLPVGAPASGTSSDTGKAQVTPSACMPGPCMPGSPCGPYGCFPGNGGPCGPMCGPMTCMPGSGPCYPAR